MVLLWCSGVEEFNTLCCLYLWIYRYEYRPFCLLQTDRPFVPSTAVSNKTPLCVFRSLLNFCNAPVHNKLDTKIVCNQQDKFLSLCNLQLLKKFYFQSTFQYRTTPAFVNCEKLCLQWTDGQEKIWTVLKSTFVKFPEEVIRSSIFHFAIKAVALPLSLLMTHHTPNNSEL